MRRVVPVGLAVLLLAVGGGGRPAAARELLTNVDLDYLYEQRNEAGDVRASTSFLEKYEIKYQTSLTSSFDFAGAVRLELDDKWYTSEADTSRVAPSLELSAKSAQTSLAVVYSAVVTSTDAFYETAETEAYSSSLSGDLQMTPPQWPELKLKLQSRRDYQEAATDRTVDTLEGTVLKDLRGLRLELNLKTESNRELLPTNRSSDSMEWTGKATYKEVLYGDTEFELAYEVKESYKEDWLRSVFVSGAETYEQKFKTRLRNSLALSPRLTVRASWEYGYDQDLLMLSYDYRITNKFLLDARWDLMAWLKVAAEAKRDTELMVVGPGEDDKNKLTDSVKGTVDIAALEWLKFNAKAEFRRNQAVEELSGGSVDIVDEEKYEATIKNRFGDLWDLTLSGTSALERTDGWLTHRESRLRSDLRMRYLDLTVQPSYDVGVSTDWETGSDEPTAQRQDREAKLKFEYRMQLLDLFAATFTHEYGVKETGELDEVLSFERTLQFNEDTRFSVVLAELFDTLRLEGEIARKASDTENDIEPELIELTYALKLDWKKDAFTLSSSFRYDDKGDTYDALVFNTRVGWQNDLFNVSGEYQYDKIFADVTDETRRLNLKMSFKF